LESLINMDMLGVWFLKGEKQIIKKFAPHAQIVEGIHSLTFT